MACGLASMAIMPSIQTTPQPHLRKVVAELIQRGEISAPCAVVDVEAFDYNASQMLTRSEGLPIRVASKSLRSTDALRRALSHDGYRGILAYSLPEALNLVDEGFTDIVVAYPVIDGVALRKLGSAEKYRTHITLMVDDVAHLELITKFAGAEHVVRVAIDIDCTLHVKKLVVGPRRSPIRTGDDVRALAREITSRSNLKLVGMMAYEGQVASVADGNSGILSPVKRLLRNSSMEQLGPRRKECIEAAREFADLEFVNGGGTGSLNESAAEGTLTELAAGSGFYTPTLFDHFSRINHKAAAFFACQVSRIPSKGWATVNSGGWIASGPPAQDRVPQPVWPADLKYSGTEGAGEVQTPLRGEATKDLSIGDTVWFRHAKAGEMTEHVNYIVAVSPDGSTSTWDTYRGKGWTLR